MEMMSNTIASAAPAYKENGLRAPDDSIKNDPRVQRAEQRSWPASWDPWAGDSAAPPMVWAGDSTAPPKDSASTSIEQNREKAVGAYLHEVARWRQQKVYVEAKRRYREDVGKADGEASRRASDALGEVDIGVLRGRGPQFLLHFTAVVVIILTTLSLGILGRLSSEQLGTILAAIAGYVLGQSARSRTAPRDSSPSRSSDVHTAIPGAGSATKTIGA